MLYREFSTQEELDAQYNHRESVDDFQLYADFYTRQSAVTREEFECHLDVSYGPSVAEHMDVFPATEDDAPVVLFIHGGYWHSLTSKEFSFVANGLVPAGVTTAVLNYGLCPAVTIDEIVRQCRAAVVWLLNNADEYGSDPSKLYVAGHSAGGHLTAMVLSTDWEERFGITPDGLIGGCAISGLFDLEPFPYTYLQPKLQLTWPQIKRNSPIRNLPDSAPPLLVSYGGDESAEMHRQSADFLDAWQASGLEGRLLEQSGENHFTVIGDFLSDTAPLSRAVLEEMNLR